jgi:hypothetical protein
VNRLAFVAALFLTCAIAAPPRAFAQFAPATPEATPTPIPLTQYTDPGMAFTAPPEFYRVPVASHDPAHFDQPAVMAAWVANPGKREQLTITITMENHDGNLDGFEMISENEVRDKVDSVFFKKHELTKLQNGMPAYWQELSMGSGFDTLKRFDYVWIDGTRGVLLAITGRYGVLDEPMARKALAIAYGVQYPQNRH